VFEIDGKTARNIGLAWMTLIWNVPTEHSNFHITREGHIYMVEYAGPDNVKPDDEISIEPVALAISARDGALVGGSVFGSSWIRKDIRHGVFRACTANGLDVTSALWPTWERMISRASIVKADRSPTMLEVEEVFGDHWTVTLSGRAVLGATTLLLKPTDRAFLHGLAAVRLPSPSTKVSQSRPHKP